MAWELRQPEMLLPLGAAFHAPLRPTLQKWAWGGGHQPEGL